MTSTLSSPHERRVARWISAATVLLLACSSEQGSRDREMDAATSGTGGREMSEAPSGGTGGRSSGGAGGSVGGAGAGGGTMPSPGDAAACESAGLQGRSANKTNYTSYPDPGSDECVKYNGCMWAGQFAACSGKKSEQ